MSVVSLPERTRISADRYQKMVATGVLTKYDRVELIDGDILNMPPIGSNHRPSLDQRAKRALYARHGVAEYWVINMPGKRVHVYCEPTVDGYAQSIECAPTDVVSPRALPAVHVTVGTLFA